MNMYLGDVTCRYGLPVMHIAIYTNNEGLKSVLEDINIIIRFTNIGLTPIILHRAFQV